MELEERRALEQIAEMARSLFPASKWRIFNGTQNQALFEFKDSRNVMSSVKRTPICQFYYLLVRLEPVTPVITDDHMANCDECGQAIYGHRYKCTQCADFDICQKCEARSVHPQHAMLRIVSRSVTEIPRYITVNAPRYVFPNIY